MKLTLEEWVEKEKARLDQFVDCYKLESAKDPKNWPSHMNPGHWDVVKLMFDGG